MYTCEYVFFMPSTYSSLKAHAVFSTHNRDAWFTNMKLRTSLHSILAGALKQHGCHPIEVGGVEDHVHLLFGFLPTHALSDVIREVKKSSSKWVKETSGRSAFRWQNGYAVFSVSPLGVEAVRQYILNQEEHHRTVSYREEVLRMLEKAGIQPDMRYFD